MKKFIIVLLLIIPATTFAKNKQGMGQADMQNMMKQMQEVQECMARIDQNQLNQLQQRSEEAKNEIDALCAKGKKSKAQKKGIAFAKEMAKSPAIKQMKKCGELAQGALPDMPTSYDQKDYSKQHVCDQ